MSEEQTGESRVLSYRQSLVKSSCTTPFTRPTMRTALLLFLGAAATVLGSPVPNPQVSLLHDRYSSSKLNTSQDASEAAEYTTVTYTYVGTKLFDSIVPTSPWLITATTIETWEQTSTVALAAATAI